MTEVLRVNDVVPAPPTDTSCNEVVRQEWEAYHAPDGRSTVDHEYFGPKNVYTALERPRMNTSSRKIIFEYFGTISKKVIF